MRIGQEIQVLPRESRHHLNVPDVATNLPFVAAASGSVRRPNDEVIRFQLASACGGCHRAVIDSIVYHEQAIGHRIGGRICGDIAALHTGRRYNINRAAQFLLELRLTEQCRLTRRGR